MSGSFIVSRRTFTTTALLLALSQPRAWAQGFAGLGMNGQGFAPVVPGGKLVFPADHGPHPSPELSRAPSRWLKFRNSR